MMRSHLYAATALSLAIVLILTQHAAPFDGFHMLTAASYLLPSTFLLIGVIAERYWLADGINVSVLAGVGIGVVAAAIIYAHGYPITARLVMTVLVLMSTYTVGGMASAFIAHSLKRWFFVRFYLATVIGTELTRIMALTSISLLYANFGQFYSGIDSELIFGLIICIGYAALGCGLRRFLQERQHAPQLR